MKWIHYFLIGLIALSLTACLESTTKKGTVGVERQQLLTISSNEMKQGAEKAYAEVIAEAKKKKTLNPDIKQLKRVREIANRLIPKTTAFRTDAPNWKWEVNVIQSDQLNAWCMPGGKIAFYTGIIEKLNLTDDEIAAIMGHEIAHALREHGRERASQAQIQGVGLAILGELAGIKGQALDLTSMVMNVTLTLPNSREHETEADRMGVELAARAGYDPIAAVNVWQKMAKMSKDAPPEILSTHPSNETRIKDLRNYTKKVQHLYDASKKACTDQCINHNLPRLAYMLQPDLVNFHSLLRHVQQKEEKS